MKTTLYVDYLLINNKLNNINNFVFNKSNQETIQVSINRRYSHTVEYYTTIKKKEILITLSSINKSHKTKELKKPDMKDCILYDFNTLRLKQTTYRDRNQNSDCLW